MKTILITSFHVFISRNILSAPFLDLLVRENFKVVIVASEKKQSFLGRQFGGPQVSVGGIENRLTRLDAFFKTLALRALKTRSLKVMSKRGMGIEHPLLFKSLFFAPLIRPIIPFLYRFFASKRTFADIFDKYKPDVVLAADVMSANDCRIMLEAGRRGVPVVGMVRSWDNLTTKGGFRVIPNVLAVNNVIVKEEAVKLHSISPAIIKIVGIPHYDNYLNMVVPPRDEFLRKFGIGRNKRYVLYAPLGDRIVKVGDKIMPHTFDRDIVSLILKYLPESFFLLVRLPPTDTVNLEGVEGDPRLVVDRPGTSFGEGVGGVRITELSPEDDKHLVASITYSEAVLTVFSSIAVDALFLKKPSALIGFDPRPVSFWESVQRIHEFEHVRPLIDSAAVLKINNEEKLRNFLGSLGAISVPEEERKKIVKLECYAEDGKSSERLLGFLREILNRS